MLNETTAKQLRDIIQEEINFVLEELSSQKLDTDEKGVTTHTLKSKNKKGEERNIGVMRSVQGPNGLQASGRIRPTKPLKTASEVDEGFVDALKAALNKRKKDPGEKASADRIKASMKAAKEPKQTPLSIWDSDDFYPKLAKTNEGAKDGWEGEDEEYQPAKRKPYGPKGPKGYPGEKAKQFPKEWEGSPTPSKTKVTEEATPEKQPEKKPHKKKDNRSQEEKAREIGQTEMFEGKLTLSEWEAVLTEIAEGKGKPRHTTEKEYAYWSGALRHLPDERKEMEKELGGEIRTQREKKKDTEKKMPVKVKGAKSVNELEDDTLKSYVKKSTAYTKGIHKDMDDKLAALRKANKEKEKPDTFIKIPRTSADTQRKLGNRAKGRGNAIDKLYPDK